MEGVKEISELMDVEEDGNGKSGKGKKCEKEMDGVEEMNDQTYVEHEQNLESRVNKKKKKNKENDMVAGSELRTDAQDKENAVGNVEKKKKKRKRKVKGDDDNDKGKKNSARGEDVGNSLFDDDGMVAIEKVKKNKNNKNNNNEEITEKDGLSSNAKDNETINVSKKEKTKSVDNDPENPKSKEKKVRFSKDLEEVFSLPEEGLVQGKRFTKEEDEILRAAVEKYIQSHCLGEKGVEMVMRCQSHRQVRDCWKEIAQALPHRPRSAIYYRAHTLFEAGERLEWTEEEREMLRELYNKHGNNWKMLAKELKRHRVHVKDTWRRIKMERKKGPWSQEEYQSLFDHVNIDLRAKFNEEKKSKHGMLRDNICWTAISDKLSTRPDALCCLKWYHQLTSPMVAEGTWADSDDYRLLDALFNLDACCIEDVDWDDLIDQRSSDVCKKRWDQMVLHIGFHGVKSFAEQVEVLAKRYCPELIEAREAWDSKPLIP